MSTNNSHVKKPSKALDALVPGRKQRREIRQSDSAHAQKLRDAARSVGHAGISTKPGMLKRMLKRAAKAVASSIYSSERAARIKQERAIAKAAK